ncbi:MAG: hypothetical protein K2X01_07065 [Cyanobacteria bacterium]|nr:hypothetical protein [Cyanobacteriota bacterium]
MSKKHGNIIAIFSGLFWKRLWAECRALAVDKKTEIQTEERQRLLDDSLTIMDEIMANKEKRQSESHAGHDTIHTVLAHRLLETKETR